jgi:hypothetical protein
VIAGFGEESADGQIDEYRVAFTLRQTADVIYGIVWPLYGQEDEDGTPVEGLINATIAGIDAQKTPLDEIVACLNEAGVTHIKRTASASSPSIATTAARRCSPIPVGRAGARRNAGRYAHQGLANGEHFHHEPPMTRGG